MANFNFATENGLPVRRVSSNEKSKPETLEIIERKTHCQYLPRGVAKRKNDQNIIGSIV
jgi:hypothetical protein